MPDAPWISLHTPKCAGSFFCRILQRWFGSGYLEHHFDGVKNRPPARHDVSSLLEGLEVKAALFLVEVVMKGGSIKSCARQPTSLK